MTNESKCPMHVAASDGNAVLFEMTNRLWWPQQLDLSVLHPNSTAADPMAKGFDTPAGDGRDSPLKYTVCLETVRLFTGVETSSICQPAASVMLTLSRRALSARRDSAQHSVGKEC